MQFSRRIQLTRLELPVQSRNEWVLAPYPPAEKPLASGQYSVLDYSLEFGNESCWVEADGVGELDELDDIDSALAQLDS